ncbi:MAG: ATP-binding cassette domain-containing protein [Treponema sp.]|nr:ATP-binding cassette domain-containing protein [Treponema sp.]
MIDTPFSKLKNTYPFIYDFFDINALPLPDESQTFTEYAKQLSYSFLEDKGFTKHDLIDRFTVFMTKMKELSEQPQFLVDTVTIQGGYDKSGNKEKVELVIQKGQVISIVGPTGSGKSRLLADIEWIAQRDTVTNRKILINGQEPPDSWRFSMEHKLVAQLSQNMNFVMDISVIDFIRLHAQSRMIPDVEEKTKEIIETANLLSGEHFDKETPLTALSGGQSRALMVSDTAVLSRSPIVLIDEIENAGINKRQALAFLSSKQKIVLIATHDPLLALTANKRIVIKNGGIYKIIETNEQEKKTINELIRIDEKLQNYRDTLRSGEIVD